MPYELALMDDTDWSLGLDPDTASMTLDAIDVRPNGYALVVLTPQWFHPDDVDPFSVACFVGVVLAQTDDRLNLTGRGLEVLLGYDNDGGDMAVGYAGTTSNLDLEAQLDARVFPFANGLTKGSVNSNSTTRTMAIKRGTTRRQWLDTICAAYSDDWEWRINWDGTIDVDLPGTLFADYTTPRLFLTADNGSREGDITGVSALLSLDEIDVTEARSAVTVPWNETPADFGQATTSLPSGWTGYGGSGIVQRSLIDYQPKVPFSERRNKSVRFNANAYAAWALNNSTQANRLAARHIAKVNTYDLTVTALLDPHEHHPTRFCKPGDRVWVWDQARGLVDTANEVYYRGEVTHPLRVRVQRMTCPFQEGMGAYIYRHPGTLLADITRSVVPEEESTAIELGTRSRVSRAKPRPKRINRAAFLRRQRQTYRAAVYAQSQQR